jgi:hypothetical protein
MKMRERLVDGFLGPSGLFIDVEGVRQHLRIRQDVEPAAPDSAAHGLARSKPGFREF